MHRLSAFSLHAHGFVSAIWTFVGCNRAIVYSYYIDGFLSFYRLLGKKPKSLIVFQVHPTPWHINDILNKDIEKSRYLNSGDFEQELEAEFDEQSYQKYINNLNQAQLIICASSFTAQSIKSYHDIIAQIAIVPYGSKFESMQNLSAKNKSPNKNGKIRLLTVAQVIHRKGLHYAFNVMKNFEEQYEWIIVANKVDPAIAKLAPNNVVWKRGVSDQELANEFSNADLFPFVPALSRTAAILAACPMKIVQISGLM